VSRRRPIVTAGAVTRFIALGLVAAVVAGTGAGCGTAKKTGTSGSTTSPPTSRTGPKDIVALRALLKQKYGAKPWYAFIKEVRFQTKFGRPVITVFVKDEPLPSASKGFDPDRAILLAIENSQQAFANNYETENAYGLRLRSSEGPFAPIPPIKPLASLPKPKSPAELKTWLAKQWGPQGANPLKDELWFDRLMAAPMTIGADPSGKILLIHANLPWTGEGTDMHMTIMYAVGLAGATFVKWQKPLYADASKNNSMDLMEYEFPYQ
jgi:hypothetical protein